MGMHELRDETTPTGNELVSMSEDNLDRMMVYTLSVLGKRLASQTEQGMGMTMVVHARGSSGTL
jgi:hypothetical protein